MNLAPRKYKPIPDGIDMSIPGISGAFSPRGRGVTFHPWPERPVQAWVLRLTQAAAVGAWVWFQRVDADDSGKLDFAEVEHHPT
jgi:hypothetical protein